jgi:hypothetical protein
MNWNPFLWRSLLAAMALAGILTQATCGGGGSSTTVTITAITISPSSTNININATTDFTASVTFSNPTSTTTATLSWQVNCITGGNSQYGTIVASATDNQVGIYTAPGIVPTTPGNAVTITASASQTGSTSTPCSTADTISSNQATVTVGEQLGINVSPTTATVPAAGSHQFTALQNNLPDTNVDWTVTSSNGGNVGSIDNTGLYTAPLFPPPGAVVTITATDNTVNPPATATATATITYSDASLYGPFAFSYSGGTGNGFMAVAGSFVADGNGNITGGLEDINSFSTGSSTQVPIYSGNYDVEPDGRTSVTLNTGRQTGVAWQFALSDNQHGLMILFNKSSGGSGTLQQQNLNDLAASDSVLMACGQATCPYVFSVSGSDSNFNPLALAGRFSVNGSGQIPQSGTILDVNDNGTVTKSDTSLNGSYSFDTTNSGTGRGTVTLTSATTGQIQYAFYVVDSTHLKLVETDANAYLAGDMFSAPTGNSFTVAELSASTNYVFTAGGNSSAGAYASGGVFTSGGNGTITGGVIDSNNAGTITSNTTLAATCPYTVDPTTGRIDLQLCTSAGGAATNEYAAYPTASGGALLLEIDANAISNGQAYPQSIQPTGAPVQAPMVGSFALNLGGEGISKSSSSANIQALEGQATLNASSVAGGTVDINSFNSVFPNDPLSAAASSLTAPSSPLGRGTATLGADNPDATYSLIYYVIDNNTSLLLDVDTVRVGVGMAARQY